MTALSRVRPEGAMGRRPICSKAASAPQELRVSPTMATHRMPSKKNWAVVRRLVGYQRLEGAALPALERVHDLARDYVNFLHPVRRMTEKVRLGARVTRRYDTAQTPYRRLLASGCLSQKAASELARRSKKLDPLHLKLELESAQRSLAERAVRPAVTHPLRSDHL
jgi:hypothetical protein